VCAHLLAAFWDTVTFTTIGHLAVCQACLSELHYCKKTEYSDTLSSVLLPMPSDTTSQTMWLTLVPSLVNGTKLLPQAFWDHHPLFLHYYKRPIDLPSHCDDCLTKFSMYHALKCKKCNLVIMHHNKIKDKLCDQRITPQD
jgi:hypothetical protein